MIDWHNLGSSFVTGMVIQYAPGILKGAMKEYLGKIVFEEFVGFVRNKQCLWDTLPANLQNTLEEFGPKLGELEWLTGEWLIETGRESAPAIYSLVLGWPEAEEWLENQVNDIKLHMKGVKNDTGTQHETSHTA